MNEKEFLSLGEIWDKFYDNLTRDDSASDYLTIEYFPTADLNLKLHNFVCGDGDVIDLRYLERRIEDAVRATTGCAVSVRGSTELIHHILPSLKNLKDGGSFKLDLHVFIRNGKEEIKRVWSFVGHKKSSYKHVFLFEETVFPPFDYNRADKGTFYTEGCGISISDPINITIAGGRSASGAGIHSGHQTRVCRNKYATYTAYVCEEVDGMNHLSVTKITRDGDVKTIFEEFFPSDSSSTNIMRDDNDDIYVVCIPVNKLDPLFAETAWLAVYKIDPLTDEVEEYKTIRRMPASILHGHGYAQPCFDPVFRKIYAIYAGGDAPGCFAWFAFDLETKKWLDMSVHYPLDYRYCYHIPFSDGKGGFVMTSERDIKKEAAGHPEIYHAEYSWDELQLFTVPDYTKPELSRKMIEPADFSRTSENLFPAVLNNQEGGAYKDTKGRIHVLYSVKYYSLLSGRGVERILKHKVFDGENEIYEGKTPFQGAYSFRMYQSNSGRHYIFAMSYEGPAVLEIWRAKDDEGFEFEKVAQYAVPGGDKMTYTMSVASMRNNSYCDNVCDIIYSIESHKDSGNFDYIHLAVKFDEE